MMRIYQNIMFLLRYNQLPAATYFLFTAVVMVHLLPVGLPDAYDMVPPVGAHRIVVFDVGVSD